MNISKELYEALMREHQALQVLMDHADKGSEPSEEEHLRVASAFLEAGALLAEQDEARADP